MWTVNIKMQNISVLKQSVCFEREATDHDLENTVFMAFNNMKRISQN